MGKEQNESFDSVSELMQEHFRKRCESIERESERALADVFSRYGMGIDTNEVKTLVHFICVLKNEGIETPEDLDRFIAWYRKQGKE